MPWWGWLIAFVVVWVSLVAGGVYVYVARKAVSVMSEITTSDLDLGPRRRPHSGF